MTLRLSRAAVLFASCLALALPAVAQDAKPKTEAAKPESKKTPESVLKKKTPAPDAPAKQEKPLPIKKWIDAENALLATLSDDDKENFFIIRNKYSIIRVIGVVERDVGTAVKLCGEKNPSIKAKMDKRFGEWRAAVDPVIDTAKKTFERDFAAATYVDQAQARNVLKLNDEAYEFSDKKITKVPLTTPDACQGLLDSMDRTEDEMVQLLQNSLLPASVIKKREAAPDIKPATSGNN